MKSIFTVFVCFLFFSFSNAQQKDTSKITVSVSAKFPKGMKGWNDFLWSRIDNDRVIRKLPKELTKDGFYQELVVRFTIMKDGTIGNITFEDSVHQVIKDEILHALKNAPKWNPATLNNQPVESLFRQAFLFRSHL